MQYKTYAIAGLGAIGQSVAKGFLSGAIDNARLVAVSESSAENAFLKTLGIPNLPFDELCDAADCIIECLPAAVVPSLMERVFLSKKDAIVISSAALLIHPVTLDQHKRSDSRIIVPSGAIAGLDGVQSMKQIGINTARIATCKAPGGYKGAPYVIEKNIDLDSLKTKTRIFSGNALEAARGFPANVNVAATLSLAGIGPERTLVEIWADPAAVSNTHEITVESDFSTLTCRIENRPDPQNPKSSMLAAQSILRVIKGLNSPLAVL